MGFPHFIDPGSPFPCSQEAQHVAYALCCADEGLMDWNGVHVLCSERDEVAGSCQHGNEPIGSINCWQDFE